MLLWRRRCEALLPEHLRHVHGVQQHLRRRHLHCEVQAGDRPLRAVRGLRAVLQGGHGLLVSRGVPPDVRGVHAEQQRPGGHPALLSDRAGGVGGARRQGCEGHGELERHEEEGQVLRRRVHHGVEGRQQVPHVRGARRQLLLRAGIRPGLQGDLQVLCRRRAGGPLQGRLLPLHLRPLQDVRLVHAAGHARACVQAVPHDLRHL
mmetsp:Transcript_83450/g.259181  ORF Transcript_83450/g.259181 Transcript_83450/m.259181 type:complete len:205 (+) Transcript_83450:1488-2102(+)